MTGLLFEIEEVAAPNIEGLAYTRAANSKFGFNFTQLQKANFRGCNRPSQRRIAKTASL